MPSAIQRTWAGGSRSDPHTRIRNDRVCRRLYQSGEKEIGRPSCLAEVSAADPGGAVVCFLCTEDPLHASEHEDPFYVRARAGFRDLQYSHHDLYRGCDSQRHQLYRWRGRPLQLRHRCGDTLFCHSRGSSRFRRYTGRFCHDRSPSRLSPL